ncbi:MAG TPA: stage II sporulation protein M [Aggregatilineaceae bacterium]|nr:stage II sporulation protein M [Aggregatilineaceae bacterium]
MNVNEFIRLREKDWERLQFLIDTHKGRKSLNAAEVQELGTLYRAVTSDLALARRDYEGHRVGIFLNQLLTRAHSYIYQQEISDVRHFGRYFTHTIPQMFRETWVFTFVAFLLFFLPALLSFALSYNNPDVADNLGLGAMRDILAEKSTWTDIPVEERPYTSTYIMTNNIRVALMAFGGGVLLGLFSIWALASNGIHFGAVMGLAAHYGMGRTLLDFVFAHGVVELSIIFMSGGAGLQLGWALINPGLYSRRDAIAIAGRRAIALAVLAIPALVTAGLIEGFLSPSDAPFGLKVMVGLGTGTLLYSYLYFGGREP